MASMFNTFCQICGTGMDLQKCHVVDASVARNIFGWSGVKTNLHNRVCFCGTHHAIYDYRREGVQGGEPHQFEPRIIADYLRQEFVYYDEDLEDIIEVTWPVGDYLNEVDVYRHYFDWKNARCSGFLKMELRIRKLPMYDPESTPEEIRNGLAIDLSEVY